MTGQPHDQIDAYEDTRVDQFRNLDWPPPRGANEEINPHADSAIAADDSFNLPYNEGCFYFIERRSWML